MTFRHRLLDGTGSETVHGATESNPGGGLVLVIEATGASLHPVGAVVPRATLYNADFVVDKSHNHHSFFLHIKGNTLNCQYGNIP